MPKISFISNDNGANYSRTRKRVRGDSNRKPEIKTFDPFKQVGVNAYVSHRCFCGYAYNQTIDDANDDTMHWNHSPWRLNYPGQGVSNDSRIGNEIFLKYIRLKGVVQVDNYVTAGVRWRLILLKLSPGGNDDNVNTMNVYEYLNMFKTETRSPPSSWAAYTTPESVQNFDDTEAGALMNYYFKVKDPMKWQGWKRKVLASGYVPPSFVSTGLSGTISVPVSGSDPRIEAVSLTTERFGDGTTDYQYNSPLDIKITLNDRINIAKSSSIYWFVFESDCACSFSGIGGIPHTTTRGYSGSPVKLNFISKAYFTDA